MAGHAMRMLAYNGSVVNMKDGDFFVEMHFSVIAPISSEWIVAD